MEQDIKKYIPQREPIIMIDSVIEKNGKAQTFLNIKPNNIFSKDGFFREPGLIEHIAQSAAAIVGLASAKENKDAPLGFIASVRDLEIMELPETGSNLTTEIEIVTKVLNVIIVKGITRKELMPVAKCEMRIFINE